MSSNFRGEVVVVKITWHR